MSLIDRLWLDSHRDEQTGCNVWTGQKTPGGYGRVTYKGIRMVTHKFSYLEHGGIIPDRYEVCHFCDVNACWRWEHLYAASHTTNMVEQAVAGLHRNQLKTHCVNLHEFAKANTKLKRSGTQRACRTCDVLATQRSRQNAAA